MTRPFAIALVALAAAGCGRGGACTDVGCGPPLVTEWQSVGLSATQLPMASFTACRNQECGTLSLANWHPASVGGYDVLKVPKDGEPATSLFDVAFKEEAGVMQMQLWYWHSGPASPLVDGDLYSAELKRLDHPEVSLWRGSRAVTYKTSRPNGPGCEPECRGAGSVQLDSAAPPP